MAIPKLLKTMRESLSGVENNVYPKELFITDPDGGEGVSYAYDTIAFRKYIGSGLYDNISLISPTSIDIQPAIQLYGDYAWNGIHDIKIMGVAEPTEDTDAANKAYVDNNGGTFTATYGTTTYDEIVEAFNQGKTVYCYNSSYTDAIYILTTRPTGSNVLYFYDLKQASANNGYATTYANYCMINFSGNWSVGSSSSKAAAGAIYYNGITSLISTTGYYRPIRVSTSAPTSSDGNVGDIWIQYFT